MVNEVDLFESPDMMPLDYSLCRWMRSEVCKSNVLKVRELLARILDTASRIRKHGDQLRQTILDVLTGVENAFKLTMGFQSIYCEL